MSPTFFKHSASRRMRFRIPRRAIVGSSFFQTFRREDLHLLALGRIGLILCVLILLAVR
jgi:hypothetical protein